MRSQTIFLRKITNRLRSLDSRDSRFSDVCIHSTRSLLEATAEEHLAVFAFLAVAYQQQQVALRRCWPYVQITMVCCDPPLPNRIIVFLMVLRLFKSRLRVSVKKCSVRFGKGWTNQQTIRLAKCFNQCDEASRSQSLLYSFHFISNSARDVVVRTKDSRVWELSVINNL